MPNLFVRWPGEPGRGQAPVPALGWVNPGASDMNGDKIKGKSIFFTRIMDETLFGAQIL